MSLSFFAAGVGVCGGVGGLTGCLRQNSSDSASCGHRSFSEDPLSDQIKLSNIQSLYFLLRLPVSVVFSTCLLPSTGRLWDMFVRGTPSNYVIIL